MNHFLQLRPAQQILMETVTRIVLLLMHCLSVLSVFLGCWCWLRLPVYFFGPFHKGVPHVLPHEVEEGPAGELVQYRVELEIQVIADPGGLFSLRCDVPDGLQVAQGRVGAQRGDGAPVGLFSDAYVRVVADLSQIVKADGELRVVFQRGDVGDLRLLAPGHELVILADVLHCCPEDAMRNCYYLLSCVGERSGGAQSQLHMLLLITLNEAMDDQKQTLMSCSQRPTVTGHTLKPLCLSLSVWAVSLVAMLLSSSAISTSTFHSLSASTLERWTTFWSKVCLLPSSFHMQVSPPMTLTLGMRGSQEYILRQSWQTPYTLPYMLLKPMSRQVRSQLLRMTSFLRPTIRLTLALTPHQSITSSSCSGRSMSSLAQQITFLLLEMFRHTFFCCSRQQTASEGQSGMLLAAIQSRMLCRCPQHSKVTSSPPKCTYSSSSKVEFTYFITSVTTSQVRGMVGSNWPMQSPLQFSVISAYFSLLPQDSVCAGESISGITRIPRTLAQSITVLMFAPENSPPMLPYWLSSGTEGTSIGKESQSMMCQWSTLSLEQSMESIARRMVSRGRQCLEVSIISPRHLKEGESCTEIGRPLISQLPPEFLCSSCEKVSKARRNPGQKPALSSHFPPLPSSREYTSWLTSVGMSSAVSVTAILSETWPASRISLHLKTLVRYQSSICCISELEGASMMYSISQGLTGTVSP